MSPSISSRTVQPLARESAGKESVLVRLWQWYRRLSPSWTFSSLLTIIILTGEWQADILGGYERILTALGTAIVAEHLVSFFVSGKKGNTLSAYITGNSVTVLTKPAPGILWPFVLGPLLAIVSKAALRSRGQHLWNPTNLSFSLLLLVAPGSVSILSHQWGNDWKVVALLFTLGFIVVSKAKLLHISGTYVLCFAAFAALRAAFEPGTFLSFGEPGARAVSGAFVTELAPLTGPMYTLFTFFMITDPKTVVKSLRGRVFVVVIIAAVECAIRMSYGSGIAWLEPLLVAPPLFALFIVGPIAKYIDVNRGFARAA